MTFQHTTFKVNEIGLCHHHFLSWWYDEFILRWWRESVAYSYPQLTWVFNYHLYTEKIKPYFITLLFQETEHAFAPGQCPETFSFLFSLFGSDLALLLLYFISTMVEMKHISLWLLKDEIFCLSLPWFLTNAIY